MLLLGLMFRPHYAEQSMGVLFVRIISARLPVCVDTFVTLQLLPDRSKMGTQKTIVMRDRFNPMWDAIFLFQNVSLANLVSCNVLQITLSDCTGKKSIVTGFLHLRPTPNGDVRPTKWMDSNVEERKH